jgi:hypothetical protein
MVDGIQRIYDGGWDPSEESDHSESEQARQCIDLHRLKLDPLTHLEEARVPHANGGEGDRHRVEAVGG